MAEKTDADKYGDWMVVKRKHKAKGKRGSLHTSSSDAMGRSEGVTHWNMPRKPRDIHADTGKDGKRKSHDVGGTREVRLVHSQQTQSHKNFSNSNIQKDDLGLSKCGPKKLTQGNNSLYHGNVDSINRLAFDTCPTHLSSYPSDDKFPRLRQNFHFGVWVEGNGDSSGKMGDFSQRESHSYRRQNNRRHTERPNRHHRLVRGGSNGGVEKHFSPNGGECSTGISSDEG